MADPIISRKKKLWQKSKFMKDPNSLPSPQSQFKISWLGRETLMPGTELIKIKIKKKLR